MKLNEITWYNPDDANKPVSAQVYAFLKFLPDKIIATYSENNNAFFTKLSRIPDDNTTFRLMKSVFYAELIDARHAPFLYIRQIKLASIIYQGNMSEQHINNVFEQEFFSKVQISFLNELWSELMSKKKGSRQINLDDATQFRLLYAITSLLFTFLRLMKNIFGESIARILDFLSMALLALEEIKPNK